MKGLLLRQVSLTTLIWELNMFISLRQLSYMLGIFLLLSGCIIESDHHPPGTYGESYQNTYDNAEGCLYDTECYQEEYCGYEGFCYAISACNDSIECGSNDICANQRCVDLNACTLDEQCASGDFCIDGSCAPIGACQVDLDCPTAMYCGFEEICLPLPNGQCIVDEDCYLGALCSIDGYCLD